MLHIQKQQQQNYEKKIKWIIHALRTLKQLNNLISDKLFSTLTILTFTQRNEFPAKTRRLLSDFLKSYYQMITWNLKLLVHGLISGKLVLFNIWPEAANEKLDQFSIDHDQSRHARRDSQNQKLLIFFLVYTSLPKRS